MRAVLKLILRYLWKNKKRSLCLGISIMISAALTTSLVISLEGLKEIKAQQIVDRDGGNYDIEVNTKEHEVINAINNLSTIDSVTSEINLSEPIEVNSKYSLKLLGIDDNFDRILSFKFIEGRAPKADNEIALQSWIVENLNPVPKVGDKIKLKYKIREVVNSKEEFKLLDVENEFVFVGKFDHVFILEEDKNVAKGILTKGCAENILKSKGNYGEEGIENHIYIKLKPKVELKSVETRLRNYGCKVNGNYLREIFLNGINIIDKFGRILYFIILIATTIIIYNMINTSTIVKMPYMGMLKALGLTPGQTRGIIIGEGIVLGIIFITLGNILGNFIYKLLMYFIGGEFSYSFLGVPKKAIQISFIYGFIAILLGTLSSIGKVRKTSALEAINYNNGLDINNVRFKDVKELGGTPNKFLWDMAKCNIKRNKMRFIMTTVSIVITIILFIIVNYIMNAQDPTYGFKNKFNSDFIIDSGDCIEKDAINKLESIDGIKNIENILILRGNMNVPKDRLTDEGNEFIKDSARRFSWAKDAVLKGRNQVNLVGNGWERDKIEKLKPCITEGSMDLNLMDEEPVCILVQNLNYNNLTNLKVGDKVDVYLGLSGEVNKVNIKIGAILNNYGYIKNDGAVNTEIIMSNKAMTKYFKVTEANKLKINIKNKKDYEEVKEKINKVVKENPNMSLLGYREELIRNKQGTLKMRVILYSFISINALASIANIFSIMAMNVALRKKEFSMLRAVGMSKGEVIKMIVYEGLIYGGLGGIIGLSLGVPLTYLCYRLLRKKMMQGMVWNFPILMIIGVAALVIVLCLVAAMNSCRKVIKEEIVEGIRAVE